MSTTPLPSNVDYTVVGGRPSDRDARGQLSLSFVVVHRRGSLPRPSLYDDLHRLGGQEVISVSSGAEKSEVEALAQRYPTVRFIIPARDLNTGSQVNLAVQEARGRLVSVAWNQISFDAFSPKLIDTLLEQDQLCYTPTLRTRRGDIVPTVVAPALFKSTLKVLFLPPSSETSVTLFPFDYLGVYNRERFLRLGGYDATIASPYWQKMDFGFRTYLWGEEAVVRKDMRAQSEVELPTEDTTPNDDYRRFFLKNLAIRFDGSAAVLPKKRLLSLLLRGGIGIGEARRLMHEIRAWVETNRYRFVQDATRVTELWDTEE